MGLLVVFFPEENSPIPHKTKLFSSPSSSSFSRTNSNPLLSKAQSTISICALLLLTTLLLFALSTIEPTTPRRFLSPTIRIPHDPTSKSKTNSWFPKLWRTKSYKYKNASRSEYFSSPALQRMGTLYRRGSRAMSDLVVGHVADDTTDNEFKLFLRVMHRSGLTARADVVFIFASASLSSRFAPIVHEENESFFSLIDRYTQINLTRHNNHKQSRSCFDVTRFLKVGKKGTEMGEPLRGKRNRSSLTNPETGKNELEGDVTPWSYGSVLSFDPTELDPEDSLAGFLDHVPLSVRRWACYPMLLGRVKRVFKNIMLVDVKNLIVVNDPLARVRNHSPESIFLYSKPESSLSISSKESNSNSGRTQSGRRVNSGIIMGGAPGIRRLSKAMLIEIIRAAMQQQKKKKSPSESAILSGVVGNEFMLKNVNLIPTTESVPGLDSAGATSLSDYVIIQRVTSERDLNDFVKKQMCSCGVDSCVYRDCDCEHVEAKEQ